jgi:hypothetical protein
MATNGVHTERKTVFETRISMWTRSRRIGIERWIVKSYRRPCFLKLGISVGTMRGSRRMPSKGLPVPDEAATRERVLRKNVEALDLATLKDFFRFSGPTSKGLIVEKPTCDSLNTFAEWSFAGFSRVTGTPIYADDRSEVYDISICHHL